MRKKHSLAFFIKKRGYSQLLGTTGLLLLLWPGCRLKCDIYCSEEHVENVNVLTYTFIFSYLAEICKDWLLLRKGKILFIVLFLIYFNCREIFQCREGKGKVLFSASFWKLRLRQPNEQRWVGHSTIGFWICMPGPISILSMCVISVSEFISSLNQFNTVALNWERKPISILSDTPVIYQVSCSSSSMELLVVQLKPKTPSHFFLPWHILCV